MSMTSRERLLAALRRETPDRVPVSTYELVGFNSRSFENNDASYTSLMDLIRRETDCICMWDPGSNAVFLESAFPADIRHASQRNGDETVTTSTLQTPKGALRRTTRRVENIHTVWQTEHWCKSTADVDAVLSVPYEPLTYDHGDFARIKAEVGDHGIIMTSVADPLWVAADLMEFSAYTLWAAMESEHFARTVDIMHERCMENLRRMLDGGVADLYRICGPEYATPPFLPPSCLQRFGVPYVAEMVDLIHSRGAMVRLHCHGKIGKVLDMIAETGADGLDPCEAPPDGDIDLAGVKARVGGRMCIFGNIQLKLLEGGTPDEVRRAVRGCMAAAKEGGGYVIMPTAAPISSPLAPQTEANYRAYIEEALETGAY